MRRLPATLILASCAGTGLLTDGTSVAVGTHSRGVLRHPSHLPPEGDGYVVPATWRARDASWGTDELVALIVRAARRVAWEHPGSLLGVGDLSHRGGGESLEHRSHQNGRDADLHLFSTDAGGAPLPPPDSVMLRYGGDGWSRAPADVPAISSERDRLLGGRRFDVVRTWALVRALLDDPQAEVQWLFLYDPLRRALLEHARAAGEAPAVVAYAEEILRQPGDSEPHDDHLHVRIFCPAGDRALGCDDRGPARWLKKQIKYDRGLARRNVRLPGMESLLVGSCGSSLLGRGGLLL